MRRPAISVENIAVRFAGVRAVDGVNLTVSEGELRVLLGPNGAGKTTLLDLISGRTRSDHGRIIVNGTDVTHWQDYRVARAGVGRKFQTPSVFRELTVLQNLCVAASATNGILGNLGFGLTTGQKSLIDDALDTSGLAPLAAVQAGHLSHGETQWLELALLMTRNPPILLLDEPTAGMTQAETRRTAAIVNRLKGRHTVVIVEHDMVFVRAVAQMVTVLHLGKVLAEGDIQAIERNPEVRAAYLGHRS